MNVRIIAIIRPNTSMKWIFGTSLIATLCRDLCNNGWTEWDAVRFMDLGGPKEVQVQSYLPVAPMCLQSLEGILAQPGEYDWTVRWWWWCGVMSIALSTCCYVRCAWMSCYCADIELVYNAVIALVMVQPFHSGEMLINVLCEKLTGQPGDKLCPLRLRLSVSCLNTLPLC